MEKDMFGVSRLKVNLHMHTTISDGSKTPEEAAEIYKKAGYDVVAITDHWIHRDSGEIGGLRILSGAEYNIGERRCQHWCIPYSWYRMQQKAKSDTGGRTTKNY